MADDVPRNLYLDALNDMIAIQTKRVTLAVYYHMPLVFWLAMYLLAVLSFLVTGYHGGVTSSSRTGIRAIAVLCFAIMIALIADLDRPGSGFLYLKNEPLRGISRQMRQ